MRPALFSLFLVVASCSHPVLAADAGSCYAIADADARTYCLAKARRDSGTCYAIQNSGLRSQCLAEVRK
jgi:hypothetical protein